MFSFNQKFKHQNIILHGCKVIFVHLCADIKIYLAEKSNLTKFTSRIQNAPQEILL